MRQTHKLRGGGVSVETPTSPQAIEQLKNGQTSSFVAPPGPARKVLVINWSGDKQHEYFLSRHQISLKPSHSLPQSSNNCNVFHIFLFYR